MDEKPTEEQLRDALLQVENENTSSQPVEPEAPAEPTETTTDPLEIELDRFKSKKTPQEKAKDALFFNAKKAQELGLDPAEILGIKPKETVADEEDRPVTRKELEEILLKTKQETATKTAEQLVLEIENETERELTLYHIQNTIKSTGDPKEDLRLARALTNAAKNAKILEEVQRKPEAKSHSSSTSGSNASAEVEIKLTPEEQAYLNTGLVTKEEILIARQGKPIPQK